MTGIPDILLRIVEQRRASIADNLASIHSYLDETPPAPVACQDRGEWFVMSLGQQPGDAIIAEVKMGSPSLGNLTGRVAPESLAKTYTMNGAAAISVVTEPDFFFGSYAILRRCQQVAELPILAKDFIVDPVQIDLAQHAGASACLLIVALHSVSELEDLAFRIAEKGLMPLLECHTFEDVTKLGARQWPLVGVNNRDLRTFEVDLSQSKRLAAALPAESLKVAESGLSNRQDIEALAAAGFGAFLIGERLLLSEDPGAALRLLRGIEG